VGGMFCAVGAGEREFISPRPSAKAGMFRAFGAGERESLSPGPQPGLICDAPLALKGLVCYAPSALGKGNSFPPGLHPGLVCSAPLALKGLVCYAPSALGKGNSFPPGLHPGLVCSAPLALYRTAVSQAEMSQERAGISVGSTSCKGTRPARAPVPHGRAGTLPTTSCFCIGPSPLLPL